jgi:IclR family pca regulon transcriptional regulator
LRDLVGSLVKGLDVMAILASHPGGRTLTEVAAEAGLTRAGARRLLLTLVESGYAAQNERRFVLTARLLGLARRWLDGTSLWAFAEPHMREVAGALKESCSAGVLSDTDIVYVARIPGERITSVALHVGTRLPAYCTSMGRVLLAGLDDAGLRELLQRADIRKLTEKTETDRARLAEAIRQAGADGYSAVDEELEIGLRSIAVPIRDRTGKIVASVNVSTQSARFTIAGMKREILPLLVKAAAEIEAFYAV